jgi:hypothetical protein
MAFPSFDRPIERFDMCGLHKFPIDRSYYCSVKSRQKRSLAVETIFSKPSNFVPSAPTRWRTLREVIPALQIQCSGFKSKCIWHRASIAVLIKWCFHQVMIYSNTLLAFFRGLLTINAVIPDNHSSYQTILCKCHPKKHFLQAWSNQFYV